MNPSVMTPRRSIALCILIALLAAPVAAANIERTITSSGDDLDVTLTVTGIPVGGIVETFPDGCIWKETDHPADRTRISGQQAAFAVIGEETIHYRVRDPAAAKPSRHLGGSATGGSGTVRIDQAGKPPETPGLPPCGHSPRLPLHTAGGVVDDQASPLHALSLPRGMAMDPVRP